MPQEYEATNEQFGSARLIGQVSRDFSSGRATLCTPKRVGRHIESGLIDAREERIVIEVKIEKGELKKMEEGASLTRWDEIRFW